ncbi:MAG: (Fe-S)-binding protein [Flavipsychrobacter sp.]|nr:(Fe-S)-binding protein [Flavipsychrobacter sp.]
MRVQLFIPCFVDQLFPSTALNMVKVLEKLGCEVAYNPEQTCCGQPAFNAGFQNEAKAVAEKFIRENISHTDYLVAPSASCTGFVCNYYPQLFDNSSIHNQIRELKSRTFELSDFLVNVLKVEDIGASFPMKATYHDSCAALRECKIKEEPRKLLSKVAGLELVEMNDVETCCGFGGTFSVKYEPISIAMAEQKVNNALQTGAEAIISTDLSCLMHLDGYIQKKQFPLQTFHLADILASGW